MLELLDLEGLRCTVRLPGDSSAVIDRDGGMQVVIRELAGGLVEVLYEHALHEMTRERCMPATAARLVRAVLSRSTLTHIPVASLAGDFGPTDPDDYWGRLEYRLCDELQGMDDKELRALWCDGVVPRQYLLDDEVPRIVGYAWIMKGTREGGQWDFVLFLPHAVRSQAEIPWASLLPPDGASEWLEIDPKEQTLRIHPTWIGAVSQS
jgi:hypothetical protein